MQIFGIIGQPLNHSLSPKLYNTLFRKKKARLNYLPFQVEKNHLKNLILCMKLIDIQGLNITAPYKELVVPLLKKLDPVARTAQAVNTIVRKKNGFIGYNTDGPGFLLGLQGVTNFNPKNKKIIIIGAGGAARSIATSLATEKVAEIIFVNRTLTHANRLQKYFKKKFPKIIWKTLPLLHIPKIEFHNVDLLVQTTSVSPTLTIKHLPANAVVSDIHYVPLETPLLKMAKKLKLKTVDGLWMFCGQAHLNLKLWFHWHVSVPNLRRFALRMSRN